jgi:hypothetical protein
MITDQRQDQDHRPSFTREEPDISDIGVGRGLDQGQGDHAVRGGPESPVQNGDLVLARKVAQIPEKSRETIIGRLKDKGQDPSPATILREWDYHVAITTDYPDQDWS